MTKLFRPSVSFPTNRIEAIVYAEEAAQGLRLWLCADMVIVFVIFGVWLYGALNSIILGFAILIAFGCPIIMTLGYAIGCLRYLTLREYYWVLKFNV